MPDDTAIMNDAPTTTQDWRAALVALGPALEAEGRACDAENRFVAANFDRLAAQGFFALGVPAEFGGGGASVAELCAMLRELGRWDGATALALAMHTHQVAVPEWRRRNAAAPTEGLLRKVAGGARLLSSGGSDWLAGSGRAERVEGGYRMFGRKVFSSGCPSGDLLMTGALYDDPTDGPTVLHFAAPMSAPEVKILENWDVMGMRGTGSHAVEIDGLFVADEAISVRRPAGKWHMSFHVISMIAFPLIYSAYAGVADGIRLTALKLAKDPAAVGELETAHTALDLAWQRMAALPDVSTPGPETTDQVMRLRTLVGRFALEVGEAAMAAAGGAGFYREHGLEQRFRDLQAARYHPLQKTAQSLFTGRVALGLDIDG